jgi:aerobic carbon-monoxide dehydrogenase medium subunit
MDWTQITASIVLRRGGDTGFDYVRIGLNGVGSTPLRPRKAEEAVRQHGQRSDWMAFAASLDSDIEPSSDLVYSAAYKRRLAAVALRRAIDGALASLAQNGTAQ